MKATDVYADVVHAHARLAVANEGTAVGLENALLAQAYAMLTLAAATEAADQAAQTDRDRDRRYR